MTVKYIDQIDLNNKRVICRVDYNVPYDNNMNITDDTRIKATLKTIKYCMDNNARIILVSHLGRPKGKIVPEMSLAPVAERLSSLMNKQVLFLKEDIGKDTKNAINNMKSGDIALLENIRFYPEEEKNDDELGKKLAELGNVYVNDAFATAHRGHASNDSITKYINECCAGFLMKDEIEYFKKAMSNPERPLLAIIGGAKVSSKLEVLQNLIKNVDHLIIGGGMVFTFLKAKGLNIGNSLLEENLISTAKDILDQNESKILLPEDIIAAEKFENESPTQIVDADKIPDGTMGLDIGPKSIENFSKLIKTMKTIVWNGPMGAFEMPSFAQGTNEIAKAIAESESLSVIGGGDSITAINNSGLSDKMSYISTGGGAFLEMLEGKTLPAIAALDK